MLKVIQSQTSMLMNISIVGNGTVQALGLDYFEHPRAASSGPLKNSSQNRPAVYLRLILQVHDP